MSIKEQIKIALIKREKTLTQLVKELNKEYNRNDTIQNLSSKLNRNTLKYEEAEEIAKILNFKIEWNEKQQKE